MKKNIPIILTVAIALAGCASTNFTGNTLASEILKKDTYKTLKPYARKS